MTQGDGLDSLVDATADTLSDFWPSCLCRPRRIGSTGVTTRGLGGHLTT